LIGDAPRSFEAAARSTDGYVAANTNSAIITNVPLIEIGAAMTATIPDVSLAREVPRKACVSGFNQTKQGVDAQAKGRGSRIPCNDQHQKTCGSGSTSAHDKHKEETWPWLTKTTSR